ncbi:BQ2448_612 [Microbotryum intermedium]|uniref:BQ2448_612 protein n=1 Tax=Microbotryum intermedium TaxID=269621 RepID=A0A238F8R6_9BASI|nr:BQ2448_612 [Microbotryum intermedium]
MRVEKSRCLQSFAKSSTAFPYLQSALSSTASQGLVKRTNCETTCPNGTRLDSVAMPACTWNCVSWSSSSINNSGELVGAMAMVIVGILGYAATSAITTTHTGTTGKRDSATLHAFSSAVDDIFGTKDRKRDGSDLHTVEYATLFANGTVDGIYTELNVTAGQAAAYIGDSYASSWVESDSALEKRTDTLTNAKVIYHNAKVGARVRAKSFTYAERQQAGNTIAGRFSDICQYDGRAMCDCLRSGEGNEFVGALTVEGQANDNGKYQAMDCNCDTWTW